MAVKGNRKQSNTNNKNVFSHRELCFDLAQAKATNFIEVPLGSMFLNYGNIGHADVITIKPSYNKFNLDIYECKVTRSDFLQDVKSGKYKKYFEHCNRLYFACPKGIIKKEEIPENVGLIVRGEKGWSTVKNANKRDTTFSNEMLLSLVFFKGRVYNPRRYNMGKINNIKTVIDKNRLKGFGNDIKKMILRYNDLELKFKNLLYHASKKIPFGSEKECEDFMIEWEDKTYIHKW